jgi:hypothetical protein
MSESSFWNLWPEFDNRAAAIQASRQGVVAASISCILTILIAFFTLLSPIRGFSLYTLLDAAIFGIIAWRIYRLSFSWSIFGLAFFVFERIYGVVEGTIKLNVLGWLIAAIFLLCYLNSVRATHFLRRRKETSEPTDLSSPSPTVPEQP